MKIRIVARSLAKIVEYLRNLKRRQRNYQS